MKKLCLKLSHLRGATGSQVLISVIVFVHTRFYFSGYSRADSMFPQKIFTMQRMDLNNVSTFLLSFIHSTIVCRTILEYLDSNSKHGWHI